MFSKVGTCHDFAWIIPDICSFTYVMIYLIFVMWSYTGKLYFFITIIHEQFVHILIIFLLQILNISRDLYGDPKVFYSTMWPHSTTRINMAKYLLGYKHVVVNLKILTVRNFEVWNAVFLIILNNFRVLIVWNAILNILYRSFVPIWVFFSRPNYYRS